MKRVKIIILLCLVLVLSACSKGDNVSKDENKLNIVTSFFPNYDMVKKIAEDKVNIVNLTQTGDAHTFEPKIQDMEKIYDADLLIINGANFEPWVDKVLEGKSDLNILDLSENLELLKISDLHSHEEEHNHEDEEHEEEHEEDNEEETNDHDGHNHGEYDPHTWLSPKLYAKMLEKTKNKLVELDPENKEIFNKNYENAAKEVDNLVKEFDSQLSKYSGKVIVTPHEAFNYMLHEYDIEQLAIEGINSVNEPNASKMKEIVDEMKHHEVKVVFYEYKKSDKIAKAIANEIGGNVKEITTLEVISDEDLKNGEDYISLMKMNLKNIVDSFEGR